MKIAICGYKGKTGSKVYDLLKENNYDVIGIEKKEKLLDFINSIDLLIDFTNKNEALKHIFMCLDFKKPFIVGTTGFTYDELALIKKYCNIEKVKGIISYNFSMPLNWILNQFDFFNKYFNEFNYLDIHHVSKLDKISGTTYLFLLKNNKIKVKSVKTNKNSVTYMIQMSSKYDKIVITYQVVDQIVFAQGILHYLQTKDESLFMNLLD